jgi:cyclophilin family peptidyl-prolyl cis-trans isomerase
MPKPKGKQTKRIKRRDKKPRGVADWSGPAPRHGPFGIFSNIKLFYVVGAFIMIGSVATGGVSVCVRGSRTQSVTPAPEATEDATATAEAETTPSATGTPFVVKHYAAPPPMTIDTAKSYSATIRTDKGSFRVELFAKDVPNTVNNFVFLAREGFYNDVPFHYVQPDFSAQTGDPTGMGTGGPGYEIAKEPSSHPFEEGTLGMVNGSQFFVVLQPSPQFEKGDFWPFGKVVEGMDVVQQIAQGDKILSVEITEQ